MCDVIKRRLKVGLRGEMGNETSKKGWIIDLFLWHTWYFPVNYRDATPIILLMKNAIKKLSKKQ